MSNFSREWLKLREEPDLAARDPNLARKFAASLRGKSGEPARVIDLGTGTGANCRALLPRIAGDQDWVLIDRDRDLIAAQDEAFTLWSRRHGYPILAGGGRMTIAAGAAKWNVASLPLDLASEDDALQSLATDAVTAAAWFDLVSLAWLERFVAMLAQRAWPLLAVLTVDGRRVWEPALAEDEIVAAAFRQHQASDKGFGAALGADAPRVLIEQLGAQGFSVTHAPTDWLLGAGHNALLTRLVEDEARAAATAAPEHQASIGHWAEKRRQLLQEGKLRLTVGHCDILALPP